MIEIVDNSCSLPTVKRSNSDQLLNSKLIPKYKIKKSLSFQKSNKVSDDFQLLLNKLNNNNNIYSNNNYEEYFKIENENSKYTQTCHIITPKYLSVYQEISILQLQKELFDCEQALNLEIIKNNNLKLENTKKDIYNDNLKNQLEVATVEINCQKVLIDNLNQKENILKKDLDAKSEEIVLLNERIQCIETEPLLEKINDFHCPISLQLFTNPIIADDGHTYEESEFKKWIRQKKLSKSQLTSPKTGKPITGEYKKNHLIKSLINSYKDRHSFLLNQDLRITELQNQLENKNKLKEALEKNIIDCQLEIDKKNEILNGLGGRCFNSCLIS